MVGPDHVLGNGCWQWRIQLFDRGAQTNDKYAFSVPGEGFGGGVPSHKKIFDFGVFEKAIFL